MRRSFPSGEVRFAANLKWLYTEHPLEERFDAAASAGFAAVELASPYELTVPRLRSLLDAAGQQMVLINTPAGPAGTSTAMGSAFTPSAREQFRDGVMRALEYAAELSVPTVHLMAGAKPEDVDGARAFAGYVANVVWAAERARAAGVTLVLEAINKRDQPGYGLESMEAAAAVAREVDPMTVGVLFDFYHAQVGGGNLVERFEALRPWIGHVQVADNPGRGRPGSGEINYDVVLSRVAASGYEGWVGCEYDPAGPTDESLAWIGERTS
ncbi:TIM barrel protein [Microbacterium aquimaris]|uniref:hydroxypyruvate isomerase family protein n=1 Tax=Microbacterium aquimaris TaxID=459816 RepID=UPI002AD5A127|nr:TIM barrel protein [Microbacterium aquimaris]MDZ8275359.1 TIM barrel protein [Microbacterium aquimaris]